ncbi:MAG: NADP-dependent isocitrate dehydrogenase [bacterium]
MSKSKIIYTIIDEAPMLATESLLPILKAFTKHAGVEIEKRDISLAGRILALFPECLTVEQKIEDALSELGELAKTPEANIIKLPNISASVPQLKAAISELQSQGYNVPDYSAETAERYSKVLGSAVNPVLREGNSDRRVADAVKAYAQSNPHRMGEWTANSKSHVASMPGNDFYGSEQSTVMKDASDVRIEFVSDSGTTKVLRSSISLLAGELIDASFMSAAALKRFLEKEIEAAKEDDVLFSLHLKATMMKVSDPIIFGYVVEAFFREVFEKYADEFKSIGVDSKLGLGDLYQRLEQLPAAKKAEIESSIKATYQIRPRLAMVDSDKGISNLHVSSDVIIDASMPAMIRNSGQMWAADGKSYDTKAVIPDRSYAGVYQATIDFCKQHGAFDPRTMGNVSNVGLMAKKAEEYGSHDKTFNIEAAGTVRVVDNKSETVYFEHQVEAGDIWRMCQTKDVAIRDWVRLGVERARLTGNPAVFWLDEKGAHDAHLIRLVTTYLADHDTTGLEIKILAPTEAARYTCERIKLGQDTISVTGNVLRDYLTDLFPILELGTSAKMLSIVPLLAGGGLYETGAGGSAPKHVQQLMEENHLRWDSLGEFLAVAASLEDLAHKKNDPLIKAMAEALHSANGRYLSENKAPSRKVKELDNRGTHFYLALYWAEALATCELDALKNVFEPVAKQLKEAESKIVDGLADLQGVQVDIGGYYRPSQEKLAKVMRPCGLFNSIIDAI